MRVSRSRAPSSGLGEEVDEVFDFAVRGPRWVKDGPLLSRARSRSKGPLSDQVADAPDACGQCRSWVEERTRSRGRERVSRSVGFRRGDAQ